MRGLRHIFWPILFLCLFFALRSVMPFQDDWSYVTAPNMDFAWRDLLPGAAFWRPFDVLWGAVLAYCPGAFPIANRVVICLAHALNSFMVWRVLRRLSNGQEAFGATLGTLFFALSSAAAAVLVNTDTINQSWSFFFGISALFGLLGGEGWKRIACVCGLLALSMLFKESGVSWLGVLPVVYWWRTNEFRKSARMVLVFALLIVVYFTARFVLRGEVELGGGEYYALAFEPGSAVQNIFVGVFAPLSALDCLSFACEKYFYFFSSVVLSFVFWGLFSASAKADAVGRTLYATALIAVAMAFPHCFFKGHHIAEMHFYPVLFAGSFMIASLARPGLPILKQITLVLVLLLLYASGWTDKLVEVYARSDRTRRLYEDLRASNIDFSRPVWFIVEPDPDVRYWYSVFAGSAAHGLDFGKACRAFNGWRNFDWHMAYTPDQIVRIPYGAQTIRIK